MKNFLLICVFFLPVSFFLFSSCERQIDPSITMVIPPPGPGGPEGPDTVPRYHKLSGKILTAGSVSGAMVLIPTFDSTYLVDTTTYHAASGFIDVNGDTAFVTEPFLMDTAEVTKAEWMAVMRDSTDSIPRNHPKTRISWYDAVRYCMKRTTAAGFTQVYDTTDWVPSQNVGPAVNWNATGFRLPTEDEWEYAAKGGERNQLYATSTGALTPSLANYGRIRRIDPSTLEYDITLSYSLYGAECITRFTQTGISCNSRFQNSYRIVDTIITAQYDSARFFSTNEYRQYARFPVYFDSSNVFDTNTFVKHDSLILVQDSVYSKLFDKHRLTIKDYYYIYRKNSMGNTIDTLTTRVSFIDTLYDGEDIWYKELTPDTSTAIRELVQLADVTKFILDSTITLAEKVVNKRRTLRSFTKDDQMFIQITTKQITRYNFGYFETYGFSAESPFASNVFLLRDMSGNASEWCHDGYTSNNRGYRIDFRTNNNTATRVHRGGDASCNDEQGSSPSARLMTYHRESANPLLRLVGIGFRCVRRAP